MTTQNRVKPGVPAGGQYTAADHAEGVVSLEATRIRIPSDPALHRAIYQDNPSNAERRSYGRKAIEQVLEGDDFNVVYSDDAKAGIREEAARDDSMDRVLGKEWSTPHRLGDALAGELIAIRAKRLAVESHYVTNRQDLYDAAVAHLNDGPADYEAALKRIFPHAGPIWYERTLSARSQQTAPAQKRELSHMAIVAERDLVLHADRPEVTVEENPNFTSHPVCALESAIDGLIFHRGDPTCDENVRYLANTDGGSGYGNVFIRQIAEKRLAAWRHTPIDRNQ